MRWEEILYKTHFPKILSNKNLVFGTMRCDNVSITACSLSLLGTAGGTGVGGGEGTGGGEGREERGGGGGGRGGGRHGALAAARPDTNASITQNTPIASEDKEKACFFRRDTDTVQPNPTPKQTTKLFFVP